MYIPTLNFYWNFTDDLSRYILEKCLFVLLGKQIFFCLLLKTDPGCLGEFLQFHKQRTTGEFPLQDTFMDGLTLMP